MVTNKVLLSELRTVDRLTSSALEALVLQHAPESADEIGERGYDYRDLEEGRRRMAMGHNHLIGLLIRSLGRERAIELGRKAMHGVGRTIGQRMRSRLRVRDNLEDLGRAARVLYSVLGIDFRIEEGGVRMIVQRCSLARWYTAESCLIMSAADEGVVAGLCPSIRMRFSERMTAGGSECLALIRGADR